MLKHNATFLIITCLTLYACSDNETILDYGWKYGEGYHIGDVLDPATITVSNDTLFLNGAACATIYKVEKRWFANEVLIIQALDTKETGRYFAKWEK